MPKAHRDRNSNPVTDMPWEWEFRAVSGLIAFSARSAQLLVLSEFQPVTDIPWEWEFPSLSRLISFPARLA
jgi:hypothetical protein